MANVGEQLLQPETGYQRIDDSNLNIIYDGTFTTGNDSAYYNRTMHQSGNTDACIIFYVYSSKLRIISAYYPLDLSRNTLIQIDDNEESYNCINNEQYQTLVYEKTSLTKSIHKIKLYSNDGLVQLDAIDIDEDGYMVYCDDNGKLYYDMTPIMTSNTTPDSYEASASTEYQVSSYGERFKAWKMFNGSMNDNWASNETVTNQWIQLKFPNKTSVNYILINLTTAIESDTPKDCLLQGSDDGVNYYDIINFTINYPTTDLIIPISLCKYKMFRLKFLTCYGTLHIAAITELRFLLAVDTPFYLIKDNLNNKIYNYDEENNQLIEVTDTSILKENALNNICIDDLTKVKDLINLTDDNITILSNQNSKLIVNGIKSDKELIISNQNLSTVNAETIHNFLFDITKIANGNCKFVISADNGQTWLSWNGSSWDTLINTSPLDNNKIKQYSKLSDSEKNQWNKLRDEIWTSGMSTDITDVDYNSILTNKTIRFAFVLYRPTYDDNVTLKDTQWLFDRVGSWHKLSEDDIDIAINSNMCTVTPKLQNLTNVKVNILL